MYVLYALLAGFLYALTGCYGEQAIRWEMSQGNAKHDGYVPVSLDSNDFKLRWQYHYEHEVKQPINVGGKVFITSDNLYGDQYIKALSAETGEELWHTPIIDEDSRSPFSLSSPSFSNGQVYIHAADPGELQGYDTETGELTLHSFQPNRFFPSFLQPTLYDSFAVFNRHGDGGSVAAVNLDSGETQWTAPALFDSGWEPAIDDQGVYIPTETGFDVRELHSGDLLFRIDSPPLGGRRLSRSNSPVLGSTGNLIYSSDDRIVSIDLEAKQVNWVSDTNDLSPYKQPSVANGKVYTMSGGHLFIFNEETGELLAKWNGSSRANNLIVTNTHVFYAASRTYALNLQTGNIDWQFDGNGEISIGSDGLLLINDLKGVIHAFDLFPEM